MPLLEKSKGLLVFIVRRDTRCAECKAELLHGSYITPEEKGALCLSCADLDHLYSLPSEDATLTRRATKHSRLHAKVLEWSRTRKRYERQRNSNPLRLRCGLMYAIATPNTTNCSRVAMIATKPEN